MNGILPWLLFAVTAVTFLGGSAVYLRGSKDKGTIEVLTRNNDALTERATILEADVKRLNSEVSALKDANLVLQNVANSSEAIAELRAAVLAHIDEHNNQVTEMLTGYMPILVRIDTQLSRIYNAIDRSDSDGSG